ncbi:MAG: patatin-like phospholipase family protein [Psychrilyobacter sp.]|nr:patatin-like phospholipase family protein [Psychrilyobacter sp.]
MKNRIYYLFFIYIFFIVTISAEVISPKINIESISDIDTTILLKKQQIKELESLKNSILKKKQTGKKVKIGLALSGGGAKGFAHIGVLRFLEENNIKIDYISGTSMGAIVASFYALGYTPDEIETIVKTMDWDYRLSNEPMRKDIPLENKYKNNKYFMSMTYDNKLNFDLPKGVLTGEKSYLKLRELFWGMDANQSFDDFPIPLRIVATDFNTGKAKTFDHGDLAKIISASMAIPTIYDPVTIDGRAYVDGMMSRNLPVEDLFAAGADIVIASDVGAPLGEEKDYNLLAVMRKITNYRGVEATLKQRELATIIIDPDVKLEDATDFSKMEYLISEGEKAAKNKEEVLKKYKNTKVEDLPRKKVDKRKVYIEKIEIYDSKILTKEIVESNLSAKIPGIVDYKDLENLTMKLYALPYIGKAYYSVNGSTLKIEVDEKDLNFIRLGMNYNNDTGLKLAIGTDLTKLGKVGRVTSIEGELGEYNALKFNNFWYYGIRNKIGINLSFGYEENPLFVYKGRELQAKSTFETKYVDLGLTTNLFNQLEISSGLRYNDVQGRFDVGSEKYKNTLNTEYSNQEVYLKLIVDRQNVKIYPTRGSYIEFQYGVGGISNDDVEYYKESGIMKTNASITSKLSLNASLSGGHITGGDVPIDKNFKIGGIRNDLNLGSFSFYGYNMMRKSATEFLIGQIGAQYEIVSNLFLIFKGNIITYESNSPEDDSVMGKTSKFGYGATLGYRSLLGPLEFSLSNDTDAPKSVIVSINLGYKF